MANAASLIQPDAPPDLICYACTSGSIVIGEHAVAEQIRLGAPKSQPMTLVTGVIDALRTLNVKSIVVATPYIDEVNKLEYRFMTNQGFKVLNIEGMQIDDGSIMGNIAPSYIKEFALSLDRPEADAIFISCGGIRTIDILQEIEEEVNKPVICSNQAMMWSCLRRINVSLTVKGYGRLFEIPEIIDHRSI
jgi:maleate isomerase